MKFRTADLITKIDETIARGHATAAAKQAEYDTQRAAHSAAWVDEKGPHLRRFIQTATERLDAGQPVTQDDVPRPVRGRWFEGVDLYSGLTGQRPSDFNDARLLTLRAALASVTEDEVTTTGLREIGFKDIAALFSGR